MALSESAGCVGEIGKGLGLKLRKFFSQEFDLFRLLFRLIEQFSVYGYLFELLFGLLVASAVFSDHHFLDLFSLFDSRFKVPLLGFKLFVFLSDGFDFGGNLFNFFLEMGYSLFALLPDLFDLFFERFDFVLIHFGVLLGQGDLHFFLYLQHLNLFDHRIQFVDQILFFLEVKGFLSYADFAGLDLFHNLDLFVSIVDNLRVLLVDFALADEKGLVQVRNRFLVVELDLSLFDSDFYLKVGFDSLEVGVDGFKFYLFFFQRIFA